MTKLILTDKYIRAMKSNGASQFEVFDLQVPGLSIRKSRKTAVFCLHYRMDGKRSRRMTLGRYPEMSLAQAREVATSARQQISKGIDPASRKKEARITYEARLFPTVVNRPGFAGGFNS